MFTDDIGSFPCQVMEHFTLNDHLHGLNWLGIFRKLEWCYNFFLDPHFLRIVWST